MPQTRPQPSRNTKRKRERDEEQNMTNTTYKTTDAQTKKNELQQRKRNGTVSWKPNEALPGVYLFPCSPEIFQHFPFFPKIKILIFYVPCSPKLPLLPCFLHFRLNFPCSPEINDIIPLFPRTPGRASLPNGIIKPVLLVRSLTLLMQLQTTNTVEPRLLEPLWDHENLFKTWVVRAIEG